MCERNGGIVWARQKGAKRRRFTDDKLGIDYMYMNSDKEPAILALKKAVRRESDVEIVTEEVPVGDHQATG